MSSAADFKLLVSNLVATRVKKQTSKVLSLNDLRKIKRYTNHITDENWRQFDMPLLVEKIVVDIVGESKILSNFDIKEFMKATIGTVGETGQDVDGVLTPTETLNIYDTEEQKPAKDTNVIEAEVNTIVTKEQKDMLLTFNPSSAYKRKFIVLDSINQSDLLNGSGKISWDVIPSRDFFQGCVNTTRQLRNIVGIRMISARWEKIPELHYMSDDIARWTILIDELITQSTLGFEGRKYHFMTTVGAKAALDSTGTYRYYDFTLHNFNNGYFWFRRPITLLNKITLSFGCPWYVFKMKSNKMTGIGTINGALRLLVSFPSGANFANSNAVLMFGSLTITGFTTTTPLVDAALITSINNHAFVPLSYPTAYSIEFNIDLTGVTLPSNLQINVYSTNYRMIFPLEVIYQDEE